MEPSVVSRGGVEGSAHEPDGAGAGREVPKPSAGRGRGEPCGLGRPPYPAVALKETGVRPAWRKTGTACRIHDALLATRHEPYVTLMVNSAAGDGKVHALYRSWGYEDIGQSQPSPASPVLTVMIRDTR